ncbi:MAG: hypothetical protein J0I41_17605 [Filimonas sp.]|nr:hypothetical protein [Filimonas sp.]
MATLIKLVRGKHIVEFDTGKFDNWCVFLTRENQYRYAPKDLEYYALLKALARTHGHEKIYNDFLALYECTGSNIDAAVSEQITTLANTYTTDAEEADTWFTIIYGNMVAEENKPRAMLKKKIKRLAMHLLLIEDTAPQDVVNFCKGKSWRELQHIMQEKGLLALLFIIGYEEFKYLTPFGWN